MSSLVYEISPNRSCGVFVDVHSASLYITKFTLLHHVGISIDQFKLPIMGKTGFLINVSENNFLSNISKTKPFRV